MPFGKHRGLPVEDLPPSYLLWMLENIDNKPYLTAIAWEALADWLEDRDEASRSIRGCSPVSMAPAKADFAPAIRTLQREMALRFHPDRDGGSHQAMVAINVAVERLKQLAEQI
jgi:hypothetical protein